MHLRESSPKRQWTAVEQSSITKFGKALVFPGPFAPEVGPLIERGFKPSYIHCVDKQPENIAYVKSRYPQIPSENLFTYELKHCIGDLVGPWAYVHLDYCGWLGSEELEEFTTLARRVDQGGRIRTTVILKQPRNQHHKIAQQYTYPYEVAKILHDRIWMLGFNSGTYHTYRSSGRQGLPYITLWFDKT